MVNLSLYFNHQNYIVSIITKQKTCWSLNLANFGLWFNSISVLRALVTTQNYDKVKLDNNTKTTSKPTSRVWRQTRLWL